MGEKKSNITSKGDLELVLTLLQDFVLKDNKIGE